MENAIFAACELAASMASFLVAYATARRLRGRVRTVRFAGALVFALYLCAVLHVTGTGTAYDAARSLEGFAPLHHVNLVPFSDGAGSLEGFALNVVLFAPLGFALALLWPKAGRALPVAAWGLVLSLAIEPSQLLNNRATDVDDLLANTLGAVLGLFLLKLWRAVRGRISARGTASPAADRREAGSFEQLRPVFSMPERSWAALCEPTLYAAAVFAGRFLLFNEMGIAGLLYGF